MTKESLLIERITKFAEESSEGLIRLGERCSEIESISKFYNSILDMYLELNGKKIHTLYDLNGLLRCKSPETPFLGLSDLEDPISFVSNLGLFIGNCLEDDASFYVKWSILDKREEYVAGKKFNLPYKNDVGKFARIECEPFTKGSEPIIMADWSGTNGNQDVDFLNSVVDFAIEETNAYEEKLKKCRRVFEDN